jgi:hypothetical protein
LRTYTFSDCDRKDKSALGGFVLARCGASGWFSPQGCLHFFNLRRFRVSKLMETRRTVAFVAIGGLCLRSGLSDIGKGLITIAIPGTIRQHLRPQ